MWVTRELIQRSLDEIKNHLDLTAWTMPKAYTLRQIAFLDWIDPRTVKTCGKYMPIRVDYREYKYSYNIGRYKKPYQVRWMRVDEIKFIYNKRNRKKKLVEEPI